MSKNLIHDTSELAAEDITPKLLERIAADTDDTYDCHQWGGIITSDGIPYIMVYRQDQVAVFSSVARVLALAAVEDLGVELNYSAYTTCFNVSCVNKDHAALMEDPESRRSRINSERANKTKRKRKRAGKCTAGHSGPNLFTPTGACRECNKIHSERVKQVAAWFGISTTQFRIHYSTSMRVIDAAHKAYEEGGESAVKEIVRAMGRHDREQSK